MLFKSWFIDFEPFDGEMPPEWRLGTLGSIATIKTNSFSPMKNPQIMLEHYSIPAYDDKHYPVFELAEYVKSNKYVLTNNSVMISKLNPDTKRIWRPLCLSEHPVCSTEFIIFEGLQPEFKDFIYSIIDSTPFSDYICAHTTGSTNSRQRVSPRSTLNYQIPIPNDSVISDFCNLVTPIYDLIAANICENQKLAKTRDLLLPKLMSGEIDISNLEF
ncbi:MAG: restriction endonuclease subunit S [Clostridia bacterium]|nr:restriction endonuclease subunit S [Clostridia bacterium]